MQGFSDDQVSACFGECAKGKFTPGSLLFSKRLPIRTLLGKYAAQDWAVVWANTCSARWLGEPENMAAAVTRAYFSGKQGRFKEERFLESMCEKQYTCDGTCLHTYIWQEKEGIG